MICIIIIDITCPFPYRPKLIWKIQYMHVNVYIYIIIIYCPRRVSAQRPKPEEAYIGVPAYSMLICVGVQNLDISTFYVAREHWVIK